ncbi:cytochrome P450 [Suillus fuscotomentosus]|uniref:Cytochrome P450 n=1 Tax=Suillus fuscotomentosus TaxID=1912939 RepID=A0AAD4HNS6_9AGAM|nr:cytochrome P450 [Suillus fuscotomentosus]KAG1903101.1 cytochrome P450 [Suillus fuscotomentosus]
MSRSWVSPGVAYLTRGLLSVIFPTASAVIIVGRLACLQGFPVSPWLLSVVVLGAAPLGLAAHIFVDVISQRRKATRLGARLVPRIQGRWPGNLDKLVNTIQRFKVEYLGQPVLDEMKELGPTLNYRCLWEDYIVTTEPQHVKTILVTDFHNYVKGAKFREAADSVLGTGVFNSDGETWKLHRTMTRPFFTHDRISHFEIFDRHASRAIALAKDRSRMDLAIDFQDLILRFTLDSASEFLFGHCTDSLSVELPFPDNTLEFTNTKGRGDTATAFADAVSQAGHAISRRVIIGSVWPMTEIFADSTGQYMKVVDEFLDPILKAALTRHSTAAKLDANETVEDQTFLDHLIKLTSGEMTRYLGISVVEIFLSDFKVIKDETLNILLAARDTTASTLTSAIYLLAMHPEILSRLREEIISKVGLTRMPTYGDIKEMKYIQAVLNETMRLFPALPFDVREAVHDTTWTSPEPGKKPLFIPGGVTVIYSVFLMHRRTDLWGPDALEFDPDRWLDERMQKYQLTNPFIFLPFNAGPRICLGQNFAYNEMSFMLIRLLQNFSAIALSPEPAMRPPAWWAEKDGRQAIERFKPKFHVMLYAEGGMWVKMEAVDDVEVIQ